LILLDKYFDAQIIDPLSDEVLAQLVGVLPKTISMARQSMKFQKSKRAQDLQAVKALS
jgi:hypothetical protein